MAEDFGVTVSNASYNGILAGDFPVKTKPITVKSGQGALICGTVLGKVKKAVGTPVVVGTGNGTAGSIVMGLLAKIGNYVLTCIRALAENRVAPTTGTKTGTGDGTMTAVTAGDGAKKGTYTVTCIEAPAGTPTVPTTGTKTGTGNGTMTDVTAGADVQAGTYKATCVNATVSGSEVFKVVDPDGNRLDDATVGVAYTSAQLNFTINDGSTDFIVGDYFTVLATAVAGDSGKFKVVNPDGNRLDDATVGVAYTSDEINFTINDGSTDFEVGDYFTVAVTDGGVFSVRDPDGNMLPNATAGVAYTNPQINFMVSDGATDWVEGDTITIPIAEPAGTDYWIKSLAAAVDGSQEIDCILTEDVDATSADVLKTGYVSGDFNENKLTFGTGHTADSLREAARAKNLHFYDAYSTPVYS